MNNRLLQLISLLSILGILSCYQQVGPENPDTTITSEIVWKGPLDTHPIPAEVNWTYFNILDKVSYIYNGVTWDTMTISGLNGVSLEWQGVFNVAPTPATINWGYYNNLEGVSYIYTVNGWDTLSVDGENGLSFVWMGNSENHPEGATINCAYYNTIENKTFIFTPLGWETFSADGINGLSIAWKGSSQTPPEEPQLNWAYYNENDKKSYLWNGEAWEVIAVDGTNGASASALHWLGSRKEAPETAAVNDAYYNETEGITYIFTQDLTWAMLCKNGKDGKDGTNGKDGKDGISIVWMGSSKVAPDNPELNWCYYNPSTNITYIWNGKIWEEFCYGGTSGNDGASIIWKGEWYSAPNNPKLNWVYYNKGEGITYIYNGSSWQIMVKNGKDGISADTTTYITSAYVDHGDTLILNYYSKNNKPVFLGQYVDEDDIIHGWENIPSDWEDFLKNDSTQTVYLSGGGKGVHTYSKANLQLKDGRIVHFYNENNTLYKGGKYGILNVEGTIDGAASFSTESIQDIEAALSETGLCYVSFREVADSGISTKAQLLHIDNSNQIKATLLREKSSDVHLQELSGGKKMVMYSSAVSDSLLYRIIDEDGTVGAEVVLDIADTVAANGHVKDFAIGMASDTSFLVCYRTINETSQLNYMIVKHNGEIVERNCVYVANSRNDLELYIEQLEANKFMLVYDYSNYSGNSDAYVGILTTGTTSPIYNASRLGDKGPGKIIPLKMDDGSYLAIMGNEIVSFSKDGKLVSRQTMGNGLVPFPSMLKLSDGRIFFTEGVERFAITELKMVKPKIAMKKLSVNKVCLINETGRRLKMTLSLFKGRGVVEGVTSL